MFLIPMRSLANLIAQKIAATVLLQEYIHDFSFFFFQAEDGIRDADVTGVQTCALPILGPHRNPVPFSALSPDRVGNIARRGQRLSTESRWSYENFAAPLLPAVRPGRRQRRRAERHLWFERVHPHPGLRSGNARQTRYRCHDRLAQRAAYPAFRARRRDLGPLPAARRRGRESPHRASGV